MAATESATTAVVVVLQELVRPTLYRVAEAAELLTAMKVRPEELGEMVAPLEQMAALMVTTMHPLEVTMEAALEPVTGAVAPVVVATLK